MKYVTLHPRKRDWVRWVLSPLYRRQLRNYERLINFSLDQTAWHEHVQQVMISGVGVVRVEWRRK